MKFLGDRYSPDQEEDYVEIAGSPAKFARLGPVECGCDDDDGSKETASSRQGVPQSDLDELFGGSSASGSPLLPVLAGATTNDRIEAWANDPRRADT